MKQRVTESINRFAFRFKNNLHRRAKLGEPVDRNSPQFIMSQFILRSSKPQNESSVRLALRTVNPINNCRNKLALLPRIQLLVFLVIAAKDPAVIATIPMAIPKATAPKKRRKTTFVRIPEEETKFAVCGTNIIDLPASYQIIMQI